MADGIVVRILGDDSDLAKTLDDSLAGVVKWGAAAAAAAAVASVAITKSTATNAREIKNLSKLIGTSATDFQRMAAGAKTVGIEQDKLADIFKDVNDKVGDFLQTGAGPLVDFFDNIAPKVGLTADEFKNLSGPEAMQKYVDALEQANVSQAEMTFFMEAIASDASLLTPLLSNNAEGFKKIGDEAEKAGAVLSDIDIYQLEQFNLAMDSAELTTKGFTNALGSKLAPILTEGLKQFSDWSDSLGGLDDVADEVIDSLVAGFDGLIDGLDDWSIAFKKIERSMLNVQETWMIVDSFVGDTTSKQVNAIKSELRSLDQEISDLEKGQASGEGQGRLAKLVEQARAAAEKIIKDKKDSDEAKNEAAIVQIDTELTREAAKFNKLLGLEQAYQESQKEGLDSFNANNLKTAGEYAAATEKLEEASAKRKLGLASSMFGNLSSLMDTENKKLFQVGKVAALSQAIIDGYSSVLSSYKEGTKIGGPVVGAAFAATAGIATAVQISKISGASYGGGGSSAGGMASSAPSIPETQQAAAAPQQDRNLVISGIDSGSLYSGEQLIQLMDNINGAVEDGYVLKAS